MRAGSWVVSRSERERVLEREREQRAESREEAGRESFLMWRGYESI